MNKMNKMNKMKYNDLLNKLELDNLILEIKEEINNQLENDFDIKLEVDKAIRKIIKSGGTQEVILNEYRKKLSDEFLAIFEMHKKNMSTHINEKMVSLIQSEEYENVLKSLLIDANLFNETVGNIKKVYYDKINDLEVLLEKEVYGTKNEMNLIREKWKKLEDDKNIISIIDEITNIADKFEKDNSKLEEFKENLDDLFQAVNKIKKELSSIRKDFYKERDI